MVAGVAACGGGSSSAGLNAPVVLEAATVADTARFVTVDHVGIGKTRGSVEVTGRVDFTHPRGDEVAHALPDASSSAATQAGNTKAEARWIGDDIYVYADNNPLFGGDGWSFVNAAKVRAASSCLAKMDILGFATGSFVMNPVDLLGELRQWGADFQRVGPVTVHGVTTTHWRAVPMMSAPPKSCDPRSVVTVTDGRVTFDIYADRYSRAIRVALTGTSTITVRHGKPLTQTFNLTTDYSHFGAAVHVRAPPAAQVTDRTRRFIAILLGT